MANRLVIRYYPVDGEYSQAQYNYGSFGLALWLQPESSSYDYDSPTMGIVSEYPPDGALVTASTNGNYWDGNYASVVYFPADNLTPGQYVERELFLLESDGVTIRPVDRSNLPLDVYVTGPGPEAEMVDFSTGVRVGGIRGSASYAGGAVEFGLYEDDVYSALASFWIDGEFFQPKQDGTSWQVSGLPEDTDLVFWDNASMALKATLQSPGPAPGFWTQLTRTQETEYVGAPAEPEEPTDPEEPGGDQGTHTLVAAQSPNSGFVGFESPAYSNYGSLEPGTLDVGGSTATILMLATESIMQGVNLVLEIDTYVTATIRVTIEGVMPDGEEYADLVIENDTYKSLYVPYMAQMQPGTQYAVWLEPVIEEPTGPGTVALTAGEDSGYYGFGPGYGSVSPAALTVLGLQAPLEYMDWNPDDGVYLSFELPDDSTTSYMVIAFTGDLGEFQIRVDRAGVFSGSGVLPNSGTIEAGQTYNVSYEVVESG